MKIEISCEPMTPEDINEAAEALAAIIVQHLSENCLLNNRECMKDNTKNETHNN